MFKTFSFLATFAGKKAEQAGDSLTGFIVRFDPATATEAQIAEYEQNLNTLTNAVAKLRDEFNKEKKEADAIDARYHQLVAAAESLDAKAKAETDPTKKAGLEASLKKLLDETEAMLPDHDREMQEAKEAEDFLHEHEEAAQAAAQKLVQARSQLNHAMHDMEAARLHKERATEHAEQAAVLAGIRTHSDSLGTALGAMQEAAAKDNQAAEAANYKAKLLSDNGHKEIADDPNIAAALAEASGAARTPESLSDRLAALKNRSAVTA